MSIDESSSTGKPKLVNCSMPGCDNQVLKGPLFQWCPEHVEPKVKLEHSLLREEDYFGEDSWRSTGEDNPRFRDPKAAHKYYEGK
jgi:hypothetical protein